MDWRDQGILLSVRPHGESGAIIEVFTPDRGRHAGVVRGGASRKMAPILQPGAQLDLQWSARLEDHLGTFRAEPLRSRSAAAMASRLSLAGLNAVTALLLFCLPERQAYADLYARTEVLLDLLGAPEVWPLAYLKWEMALLGEMGFGLDLSCCAVTGARDGLAYVSPRTGRAVSHAGAGDWADRLLPLPPIMLGQGAGEDAQIAQGLRITGHFLSGRLALEVVQKPLPEARARFVQQFEKRVAERG
ncbi:MAG: DNA repair protein RecO [Paracoccaceae bacterium]